MKKIVFLFILLFTTTSLFSQPVQYASLEMVDGSPTGYTNILTLEWIHPDTVEISYSQRISTGGDEAVSYDLAGLDYNIVGNKITFECEENTWIIPFDEEYEPNICIPTGPNDQWLFCCDCRVEGDCGIKFIGSTPPRIECDEDMCSRCHGYLCGKVQGNFFIIVRAKAVIY